MAFLAGSSSLSNPLLESSTEEERLREAPLPGSVRGQRAIRGKRFRPYSYRKAPGHFPVDTRHLGVERGGEEMNVDSVGSQQPSVVTRSLVPTTVVERPTDRAEDLLMIQRWDQAREQQYQTIRALRLLMEVHDRSNRLLASLPMRSAPLSQGNNMGIVGRLMLRAEDVPPLVTNEDEDELTDRDAEGSVDEEED